MASVFSSIISGDIPSFKVAEDTDFYAFLDINPIARGHVLVIPKLEVDNFFHQDNETLSKWLLFAKPIALAIEKAFPCNRCGCMVMGLEVPHAHMHLVPIKSAADMDFTKKKLELTTEEHLAILNKIKAFL